jgi:hypothetical protein
MSKKKKAIEEFFAGYESSFNEALANVNLDMREVIGSSFADCFIESTPSKVTCMERSGFESKIRGGIDFYRGIGVKSMTIVSKDISMLDDFHAMAKVYWRYDYEKDSKSGSLDFHVVYLFTMGTENSPRIFAYLAGDEERALKEKGLVAEGEMMHAEN